MEEYLDIVDENGNLTGEKELRSVVHAKGLWHRVAAIYFFRFNNNILEFLVHLRSNRVEQNPNKWDTRFGGHVETGSTIKETALKEIKEELGIKIDFEKIIIGKKDSYNGPDNKEIGQFFYYEFNDDLNKLFIDANEIQKVEWKTEDEIIKSIQHNPEIWTNTENGFKKVLQDLKSKI